MGSGYRVFTAGEVLSASNVQNYLQDQAVMVFGGTAARSSAIGTANFEEGMLTYLTDVDKLQVYTGAAFADVYPATTGTPMGTLINTTSFSAVASQSINDVFSATYDNYKIIFKLVQPGGGTPNIRLRVSGADNTTANSYGSNYTYVALSGGAGSGNGYTVGNFGTINGSSNYQGSSGEIDLFDVFTTNMTRMTFTHTGVDGGQYYNWTGGINHNQTVSYTGFTIFPSTLTFTGSVSVYGYNK